MDVKIAAADYTIKVPNYWIVPVVPADTPGSMRVFGIDTPQTRAAITMTPITWPRAMELSEHAILEAIYANLPARAAVLEVRTGLAADGVPYAYSLIKARRDEHRVRYTLTMQLYPAKTPIELHGHFEERGTVGVREAELMSEYLRHGVIRYEHIGGIRRLIGWMKDPYTGSTHGFQRNLAEDPHHDEEYPDHPLSHSRTAVTWLTGAGRSHRMLT